MRRARRPKEFRVPRAPRRAVARVVPLLLALLLVACGGAPAPSLPATHSVYVWQRAWNEPLRAAVAETPAFASSLRVLMLQRTPDREYLRPAIDEKALAATGLPVIAVVRLDGETPLPGPRMDHLVRELADLSRQWRAWDLGRFDLEMDHDCATAKLDDYARLLARLRRDVPDLGTLSITALPAWRDAAALDRVLATVDLSVLQVHAVRDPAQGLFDGASAQRWVADWSRRSGAKPFLVALPAYGAQLKLDLDGSVVAVESEQRLARRSAMTRELRVEPRAVAAWIAEVRARRYPNLAGFAWFRLPHEGDERSWALRTLQAVITGQPLHVQRRVATRLRDNGAIDVFVYSDGTLDVALPQRLDVDGDCTAADGVNGYRAGRGQRWQFARDDDATLRAGSGRLIGWLRCADPARVRVRVGSGS